MIAFLTLTPDPSPFQGEGSLRFHTPLPRGRGARVEGAFAVTDNAGAFQ